MRIAVVMALGLVALGCDYRIMLPAAPSNNITNNNNNTNQNNIDISDLVDFAGTFPGTTTDPSNPTLDTPLAIPLGSESIARGVPTTNLATSCHNTKYIDAIVSALRARDQRWGYICKSSCNEVSGDTIAYKATNSSTGVWAVDVIGNHCGPNPVFTWNVVGYAADRMWTANR